MTQQQLPDIPVHEEIRTADGTVITQGLRVFTNNLDRGTVDLNGLDYEWNASEKRWVPWFYVNLDIDHRGNPADGRELQSDDRVVTRWLGESA